MKDTLNRQVKHREAFRPFAPAVLDEAVDAWFDDACPSPYMLLVRPIREDKQAIVPAVCHVDGTGRLQTVNERQNPLYARLLAEVGERTGVPVVLNTSFNENEPIVCTPAEAVDCFVRTRMDVLVLGPYIAERG